MIRIFYYSKACRVLIKFMKWPPVNEIHVPVDGLFTTLTITLQFSYYIPKQLLPVYTQSAYIRGVVQILSRHVYMSILNQMCDVQVAEHIRP